MAQALMHEPRTVTEYYAAGAGEEGEEEGGAAGGGGGEAQKAYVGLSWVLSDTPLDVETELALGFLDYLLLGTPAGEEGRGGEEEGREEGEGGRRRRRRRGRRSGGGGERHPDCPVVCRLPLHTHTHTVPGDSYTFH